MVLKIKSNKSYFFYLIIILNMFLQLAYFDSFASSKLFLVNKNSLFMNSNAFENSSLNNFQQKQTGFLKGTVTDNLGLPMPGVNIRILETNTSTQTDIDGNYLIKLPPRTYTIEASFISFQTQKISEIVIIENKSIKLNIVMKESTNALSEVVVTTKFKKASVAGLYNLQKKTVSFSDGISADLIKQTSDNNVAQVLKRVSGVTMQDNKFVVIRGMSERYNNVLLNGSSLPSTEPNRKNFSFDIIPSNLIDNVIVSKTFIPDMSGEFAGGTVQVSTLSVPEEKFFTISIGSGYNSQSFGKEFYSNTRYKDDYFFGTDKRDWFKNGWYDKYKTVYTPITNPGDPLSLVNPEQNRLAGEIPNHWGLQKFNGNPTQSFGVVGGMPYEFKNESTIGFTGAFIYRHDEEREDYDFRARFSELYSIEGIRSSFVTVTAGLFNIGWKTKNHRIDWRNLYNRRFSHDNTRQLDADPVELADRPTNTVLNYSSVVKQNTLWQTRLEGEHKLANKKLAINWFGDFNQVQRDQPDDRFNAAFVGINSADGLPNYEWIISGANFFNAFRSSGIYASILKENKQNIGGNIEFSFKAAGNNNQKLKTGYWGTFRSADFKQVLLAVTAGLGGGNINNNLLLPLQETFTPLSFILDNKRLTPRTLGTGGLQNKNEDNYEGTQNINAGYFMGDFSFFKNKLHFIGGMRFEEASMTVNTVKRKESDDGTTFTFQDAILKFKNPNWLPSATLTYDILPSLKFRAAYSRTLARADFRERSPVSYFDIQERFEVSGKEGLQDPSIINYDLRLEWYPSSAEIISASAFRKVFRNPIEILTTSTGTGDRAYYVNLIDANVEGIEFNFRKNFGFLSKGLENLYLNGNLSILQGNVTIGEIELERNKTLPPNPRRRPPNGFSPLNWNTGLTYNLDTVGASLNYNYVGCRIRFAGAEEYFDQYEVARGTLDAQFSFKLIKNKVEVKLNASDITAEPFIIYMNINKDQLSNQTGKEFNDGQDKVIRKGLNGTTYSLSISYKF